MYVVVLYYYYDLVIMCPHFSPKETLSASSYLLDTVSSKLASINDDCISLFISVISLVLKCLNELVNCDTNQTVNDTFGHLGLCIKNWIIRVIGNRLYRYSKTTDEFNVSH